MAVDHVLGDVFEIVDVWGVEISPCTIQTAFSALSAAFN